ncbi:MAG: c-type cytochrome [Halioglobus sp.]
MPNYAIALVLFFMFSLGLPLWGMQSNQYTTDDNHGCSGDCYQDWVESTGGVLALEAKAAQARAEASPAELGKKAYAGCIACHGANGEGGVGPALAGQSAADIASKLLQYKAGETRGAQSSLMWSQAALLSDTDIDNIALFVEEL